MPQIVHKPVTSVHIFRIHAEPRGADRPEATAWMQAHGHAIIG
jgi:hypothetical protein